MVGLLTRMPWNSIRFKLIFGLLCVIVPLITLLIYNNYYSVGVVHNQVALSNKNMMSMYMNQIDGQLSDVERDLIGLTLSDLDVQTMGDPRTDDEYQLAKAAVSRKLSTDILLYKSIDGFFVYSFARQDMLDVSSAASSYSEIVAVRDSLEEGFLSVRDEMNGEKTAWQVRKINETYYLTRTFKSGNLYIGAWVNAKTLLVPLHLIRLGETGAALFVTDRGETMVSTLPLPDDQIDLSRDLQNYYMSGARHHYLIVGEPSGKGSFSMVAIIPDEQILENLPYLNRMIKLISFASILLLPISLLFLRKVLLRPLRRIVAAMRRIGEGNVNMRIESFPTSDEFRVVNRTFNQMMSQIEELKIHVYEEQLSKQKAELQHLQLQINPHFYLNSLNILFNLAQVRNFELIQEMTLSLVNYFRYMFRSNFDFVPLKDELRHIRNYVRIQELRFPHNLTCSISVPDYLSDVPIPPLLIQTFVENTIKHAVSIEEPIELAIEVEWDETGLEPRVRILIRDSGKGFRESALESIRAGRRIVDEQGEHIGIWNVQERLKLLYGASARLECYNGHPQGAVVEIFIPMRTTDEGKD
ncbi:HAMP domain-containing protein [Cohnella endophytica]|uniref:HAMP domain-containing protein n=1 Tax=Cohnella endophytica TaxID=2419778 RepID=A0A494Y2M0_9BACL|nr:histidine kinase [Cohnella endophytica]RKP56240.1 HAMP domain-containing protein [Cohnella endophytica]